MKAEMGWLVLALVVAGCATPSEIMSSNAPTASLDTSAKPDQVRDCLIQHDPTGIQVVPFQGGYIVTQMTNNTFFGPGLPVLWTANITKIPTGVHVAVFVPWSADYYDRDVKPCLDRLPRVASN
jgi:hypothetical protein